MTTTTSTATTLAPAAAAAAPAGTPRRSTVRLLGHQLRYEARSVRRNPMAMGFTIAMPLLMLVIFAAMLGDQPIGGLRLTYQEYLAPRMVVLALASSSFASLAIGVCTRRGTGELKRVRSTPMPAGGVLAAMGLSGAAISLLSAGLVLVVAWAAFDLRPPDPVAMALVLLVGCASLTAMGLALATFVDRPENGIAVANGVLWPVVLLSGTYTWVPDGTVIARIADVFPLRHLNDAAYAALPNVEGGILWADLAVVAAWGVGAAVVAVRRFRWDPAPAAEPR